jgi:transposase
MRPHKIHLTESERGEIIGLHKLNYSSYQIGRDLKVPQSTVYKIIKKWNQTNSVADKSKTGRPPKLSPDNLRKIEKYIQKNDEAVATEIMRDLKLRVSPRTIQRVRAKLNFIGDKGRKKIILSKEDKIERIKWCHQHKKDKFANALFWDEKPFELYKRRRLSWHKKTTPQVSKKRTKYPPRLQVGAGISRKGKTKIMIWKGRGKSKQYCEKLEGSVVPFLKKYHKQSHRFYHDRDTCHTSIETENFLTKKKINHLLLPVRSPDLNPIEMIWNTLEMKVMRHNPTTEEELESWIEYEWKKLDQGLVNRTIDHVVKAIPQIIRSDGDLAGYK